MMKQRCGFAVLLVCGLLFPTDAILALEKNSPLEWTVLEGPHAASRMDGVEDAGLVRGKVLQDTTWVADWNFDTGSPCDDTGWTAVDHYVRNDGIVYWQVNENYDGFGAPTTISGNAAVLTNHDLCWESPDGYGNDWDQSIVLKYQDTNTLLFRFLGDMETGFDFLNVETDSLGLSESQVVPGDPQSDASDFRDQIFTYSGTTPAGQDVSLSLTGYGSGTHEVYIRFFSDGGGSDEDGSYVTSLDAALVVDDIAILGTGGYSEDFEGTLHSNVSLANTARAVSFGLWARLYPHITDNDFCTENETCAWLFSDPTLPASSPQNQYGPDGAVVRNGIDNSILSPWVELPSLPGSQSTLLSYRIFGGQGFGFVGNWSIRAKLRVDNTDTSTPGDSIGCVTDWKGAGQFFTMSSFHWETVIRDMTAALGSGADQLQVRFRVADLAQLIGGGPAPPQGDTGPGPFIDRVRIGLVDLTGPVLSEGIDSRGQSQDAFAADVDGSITPGEHHTPTTNRFGSVPFNSGADQSQGPRIVTSDSVTIQVEDIRQAGGITSVGFFGAIVEGPHANKAPPPYTVGSNGFFVIPAENVRSGSPPFTFILEGFYFADIVDDYLLGGDRLVYFWGAEDAGGGFASMPSGLAELPTSIEAAELATQGLHEMSALPRIDWTQDFLDRLEQEDPAHGYIQPTQEEIDASSQKNCVLYYNQHMRRRRSGPLNRTSFMYTLDILGFEDDYDVYDVQGFGPNNQLGGRATELQATGYGVIVHDTGRSRTLTMPNGTSTTQKVNQSQWYTNWLNLGATSEIGAATLWMIGENLLEGGNSSNVVFWGGVCGVNLASNDQGIGSAVSPDVVGQASFTWSDGSTTDWTNPTEVGDARRFSLQGGCPIARDFDGLGSSGGTITHVYNWNGFDGDGAIVMNRRDPFSNTILSSFDLSDIRNAAGPGHPARDLVDVIVNTAEPVGCPSHGGAVDVEEDESVPAVTALHQNAPNPFNPTTRIQFDLSRSGWVGLRIYDVGGRLVRTLVNEWMEAGRNRTVVWDGLDGAGGRVSSGVYVYRLETVDLGLSRKMTVLK